MRGLVLLVGMLCAAMGLSTPSVAQVRCKMPNGVVIEQRLSDTCPQGAVKSETMEGAPAPVREQVLTPPQPVRRGADGRAVQAVSATEYGAAWPLSVHSGDLRCLLPLPERPDLHALVFVNSGQTYALNGIARTHAARMGWRELAPLWRDSPANDGTKVLITPLINQAERLCNAAVPPPATAPKPAVVSAAPASTSDGGDGFPFWTFLVIVGGLSALVMAMRGSAGVSGPAMFCTSCGHEGPAKTVTRGHLAIEIILWLCFFVPGLIYSVWRLSSKYKACSSCGARSLVPLNSPVAVATKKRLAE